MAIACVSFATSNVILMITGALSLPLYFSFYGSQAAIRFSLLLCIHSCILAAIPKVLKSVLPMLQLLLFAALLLLPFNTTPSLLVWCYQKLLHLSESVFLIIEAAEVVFLVMCISQAFVNEIDEQPVVAKSCILAISAVSYLISVFLSYHLFVDIHTTHVETWVAGFGVSLSVLMSFICIYKEEGIISDAAVISFVMMLIVWAMKQERLTEENSLDVPAQWLQSFNDNRSYLSVFLSMATVSIEHLTRVQKIISIFVSPACLLFGLVRVASVAGFLILTQVVNFQEDEDQFTVYLVETKPNKVLLRPLFFRLIIIFVYTQVIVRTIDPTTTYNVRDLGHRASSMELFLVLTGNKVWRIVQLLIVTITYLYQLFKQLD